MNISVKMNTPCELINVTPLNPLISQCQIKVCYVGEQPNRNGSIITKEVATNIAKSLPGSPIVGYYNDKTKDFEEHNRVIEINEGEGRALVWKDTTKPYGFVDLNAQVWFQDYLDGDTIHTYLVTEGYLWTGQYPEAQRVIEQGNNQSMELDIDSLHGSWTYDDNNDIQFFIINDAIISKLCILGNDFEPCFEGAQITKFSFEDEFNQRLYSLMKEVKKLKGGNLTVDENKLNENGLQEEPIQEENPVPEVPAEEDKPVENEPKPEEGAAAPEEPAEPEPAPENEPEAAEPEAEKGQEEEKDEGEGVQFSLVDFQNLQESYSNLQNEFNGLQTQYNELKASYDVLVEFKNTKDREEKQYMIDSFYMLGEEDKKDVQDNIDKYSLDEIEAKLAIICVHNKLDLSGKTNNEQETTFSLENVDDDSENANVPALVSVLRKNRKNEN